VSNVRALATATTVIIVLFFAVLVTAQAQKVSRVTNIKIPPGANVQVDGKTARMISQGATGGSWDCSCTDGSGTCVIQQGPNSLYCGGQGSTCKSCTFISTTGASGMSGAARAPAAGATRSK
jgi:hypothetical protein